MGLLDNLVNEFTHKNHGQQGSGQQQTYGQEQGYYGQQQQGYGQQSCDNQGPPQVPPPWVAEWDAPDNRWIYINRQTGERTFNHPGQHGQQSYGGGYGNDQQQYSGGGGYQQARPAANHSGRNAALAGVAGLAGGALLMHEGEKVEGDWDQDKYRAEQRFDNGINDVENAPDDAARWAGRGVQDVDDIPQDVDRWKDREEYRVDQKWDNGVQDVEDAPEDAARWAGRGVQDVEDIPQDVEGRFDYDRDRVEDKFDNGFQDVERFDNNVDNSYDQGRDQGRNDDNW